MHLVEVCRSAADVVTCPLKVITRIVETPFEQDSGLAYLFHSKIKQNCRQIKL